MVTLPFSDALREQLLFAAQREGQAATLVDALERFIRAVTADVTSDYVEDAVHLHAQREQLTAILAVPVGTCTSEITGIADARGPLWCTLPFGHPGRHRNGPTEWTDAALANEAERLADAEELLRSMATQDFRGPEPADRAIARRYFERHPEAQRA